MIHYKQLLPKFCKYPSRFLIALTQLLTILLSINANANIKSIPSKEYTLQTIFKENDVVWGFDFLSEHEILVTLREGKLFYYNITSKEKVLLPSPKVKAVGQGGLLDVKIYRYQNKTYVYLTYSKANKKAVTTALARGEYNNKNLKNLATIFEAKVVSNTTRHFGSRLFISDNQIFMTVGDRGERTYAQSLKYHNGKVLRLTLEGTAAQKNPFSNVKNALPEIWSYGHRNPQGIDIDPVTNKIYSCEFGPRGGDELNLIQKGKNYGWPIITHGREYYGPKIGDTHKKGMEQPITFWTPSISPSGMVFYTGDKIQTWKNSLFLANLGSTHLRRLVLKNNKVTLQEVLFKDLGERLRQVKNGPDGYLYFSTDSGKIMKIINKKTGS